MKTFFDNEYLHIWIDEEVSMVKSDWKSKSIEMTNEEFKELGIIMLDAIKKHSLKKLFSDTRDFQYTISPEIQGWFAENVIVPCCAHSLKYVAYLISKDVFSQLSVEQLMDENKDLGLTTRYFEDEQEAVDWLSHIK